MLPASPPPPPPPPTPAARRTRIVFLVAGIYGSLIVPPQYLLEDRIGRDEPPPITHPEYFYGFLGVAAAWQVAILIIAHDPVRHRPLMIPAALEKLGFGLAAAVLFILRRCSATVLAFGLIDLGCAVAFGWAWRQLRPPPQR